MEPQLNLIKNPMSSLREKKWLVIYTRPRWEKKVDKLLKQRGIESYCPLREVVNQWADRKKEVSLPLFNSYIFVNVDLYDQANVLYTLGVMGYVYYMGKPAVVRNSIIEQIKINLANYKDLEIVNLHGIAVGDTVKIKNGALTDQLGKVIQIQGKNVLMVFDTINCALVTRVALQNLTLQDLNNNHEN
jgi:transcription antitermination factor NusG